MKILLLSKKFPYPLNQGEPIAIASLSRSLRERGCDVSLLALNTSKHFFDPAQLPASHNPFSRIETVEVDNRITAGGALRSLLRGESYILSRFFSKKFSAKLAEVLRAGDFDVVQLETIYLAHYLPVIRQNSRAVVAIRTHNVEHEIWERHARNTPDFFKKWYLRFENRQLRRFELSRLSKCDLLVAITRRDLEVFQKLGVRTPAVVAPAGIDLRDYLPDFQCFDKKKPAAIAFIGALDWMPNQEGVVWFLEKVWRELRRLRPEVEFHVAGKNTPAWLRRKSLPGVHFHGEVDDAKAFLNARPLLAAPLFSGSGIKIKVLESMALGRVVLTTPVGAEGIPARHGEHLLVAETPEGFLKNILQCLDNQPAMRRMGEAARQLVGRHFDNLAIADRVIEAYEKRLAER